MKRKTILYTFVSAIAAGALSLISLTAFQPDRHVSQRRLPRQAATEPSPSDLRARRAEQMPEEAPSIADSRTAGGDAEAPADPWPAASESINVQRPQLGPQPHHAGRLNLFVSTASSGLVCPPGQYDFTLRFTNASGISFERQAPNDTYISLQLPGAPECVWTVEARRWECKDPLAIREIASPPADVVTECHLDIQTRLGPWKVKMPRALRPEGEQVMPPAVILGGEGIETPDDGDPDRWAFVEPNEGRRDALVGLAGPKGVSLFQLWQNGTISYLNVRMGDIVELSAPPEAIPVFAYVVESPDQWASLSIGPSDRYAGALRRFARFVSPSVYEAHTGDIEVVEVGCSGVEMSTPDAEFAIKMRAFVPHILRGRQTPSAAWHDLLRISPDCKVSSGSDAVGGALEWVAERR